MMFKFFSKNKKDNVESPISEIIEDQEELSNHPSDCFPIRQIIDGLLYDPSKAEYIATRFTTLDFCYGNHSIYRTRNKRFFTVINGDGIIPLSDETVKEIFSKEPEIYAKLFGKVKEA